MRDTVLNSEDAQMCRYGRNTHKFTSMEFMTAKVSTWQIHFVSVLENLDCMCDIMFDDSFIIEKTIKKSF